MKIDLESIYWKSHIENKVFMMGEMGLVKMELKKID